ncbi:phage minor capsid protein [Kitasatospora aureofaciens]|uniref:phage minor capsid protein n=1 Tax=Kitasatospora aureofaciens TaxID=1894 RepID=UPI0037C88B3F
MPVSPWMAEDLADRVRALYEDLADRVRALYEDAEQRLLGIVARRLADGLEAPGWAVAKLQDVQPLRRAAQGVVDARHRHVDRSARRRRRGVQPWRPDRVG